MSSLLTDAWLITHVHRLPDGEDFSLELVAGDDLALAMVSIVDRAEYDPQLTVKSCTDQGARAWLEALEHERMVIDVCLAADEYRVQLKRELAACGRAMRLLRGELAS